MTHTSPSSALRQDRKLASPRFDGRVFRNLTNAKPGLKPGTVMPTMKDYGNPPEKAGTSEVELGCLC